MNAPAAAILYLLPTPLGEEDPALVLPVSTFELVHQLDGFIAESAKTARHFLKRIGFPRPLKQVPIAELNEHTPHDALSGLLQPLREGKSLALLSEAGCPAVADPGAQLVALAHSTGIRVRPLVGPSAVLLALMGSGMNGQHFVFLGYVAVAQAARSAAIRRIEAASRASGAAQIFIETPYRNDRMLSALLQTCSEDTLLCLASDLTLPTETICTRRIGDWKKQQPLLNGRPSVFVLQAAVQTANQRNC